jgi:hypothetical protein
MRENIEKKVNESKFSMNRVYGTLSVGLGIFLGSQLENFVPLEPLVALTSLGFIAEGIGDLISNRHHYLSCKYLLRDRMYS